MKIKLKDWKVQEMNFSIIVKDDRKENSFDLKTSQTFSEEESNSFSLIFDVVIKDKDFDLSINMLFIFELDDIVTEEFKISDFPKINAPAIAFPYLRAFISNVTLQSGFEPVMLPSINFVELAKK